MAVIDNLIVSFDLAETTGNAVDSHTNGYHLTETGGTIASGAGPAGTANTARDFEDADTAHFAIADNADLSMGDFDFSIAAWVRLERNDENMFVLAKSDNNNTQEYEIIYSNAGNWQFRLSSGSSFANFTGVASDAAFSIGQWYFIVARHDATANTIDIGIDGDTTPNSAAYSAGCWDGGAAFFLGQSGGDTAYFDGMLAQVRLWKKKLTTDEVTWLYNAGAGRTYADIVAEAGGGSNRRRRLLLCGSR
jgi:hypothetical protein